MADPKALRQSDETVSAELRTVPGWVADGGQISKEFVFSKYLDGLDFAVCVGKIAEEMDHHPDIHIFWRKVRLTASTHSAGGITALDFDLARRIEALKAAPQETTA